MKLLKQLSMLLVLGCPAYSTGVYKLECGGDYKVNRQVHGSKHADVERAGVTILKDYGTDLPNKPGSRYAMIVVHDKNTKTWGIPAGKVEKGDKYTSETASRELLEETGGFIKMSAKEISQLDYIYHGNKQIFFKHDDKMSVTDIDKSCKAAQKNPNLSKDYKESDACAAISIPDFLDALSKKQPRQNDYKLTSRSNGFTINFEGYYYRVFENNRPVFVEIINNAFGTNFS